MERNWNCFSLQPWQWIAALNYFNIMAMTPCLIPDDKLPIILAVVIPIVVVAVFAGVFAWWMWRRNKDKKMANKGNYIKLYNWRNLFEPSVLNVQNKQYRRNLGKGFVETPTFIMHAAILNNFTQIAHITGNTCICIINVWGCTDMSPKFNSLNS